MPSIQFSGLASGIDSASLINSLVEAREVLNVQRRNDIDHLKSENDALEELNTKLIAFSELIDQFRSVNGGGIRKKATSSTSTVASASAGSTAVNGAYGLTVNALASTATGAIYGTGGYSSLTSVLQTGGSGNIQIDVGTGGNQITINVPVTDGVTTLAEVVDAINTDSNSSGRVSAAAVNTGTGTTPNYQIVITTLQQGTAKGTLAITPTGLADVAVSTIDQADNADIQIAGINGSIFRDTNSISDIINGVTFNLLSQGATTINVANDADATYDSLTEIVEAYNDIVEFINDNDIVSRVENSNNVSNTFGSFAKTRVDNDFLSEFRTVLSSANSSNGAEVTSMSELGISTARDGTLDIDQDKFIEAFGTDPTGVAEVITDFADTLGGIDGTIAQFTRFQGFIDIAQDGNRSEIEVLNAQVEQLERFTAKMRERLERTFSNLESITAELQSQGNALSGILAGL